MTPSNEEIHRELATQSHLLYGDAGLGGALGPLKDQYDRHRPIGWPYSSSILRAFGLSRDSEGWKFLLWAFGFTPPTPSDVQTSSQRRKEAAPTQRSIPIEDESYPGLVGSLTQENIRVTPLGDGWFRRTTISVYQLR